MNKMKFKFRNEIRREKNFQICGKSAEVSWKKKILEVSFVKDLGKGRQMCLPKLDHTSLSDFSPLKPWVCFTQNNLKTPEDSH